MTRYVQRDGLGKIVADFARAQPGLAEEEIAESHPDYVAWIAPRPPPTLDEIYDRTIQTERVLKAVVLALNDGSFLPGLKKTNAQLKAIIKAKM